MNLVDLYSLTLKKLNSINIKGFEGYRIDKLLTVPTQELVSGEHKGCSLIKQMKFIVINSISDGFSYDFSTLGKKPVILFYSHNHAGRRDYVEFMQMIASSSSNTCLFSGASLSKRARNFSLKWDRIRTIIYAIDWMKEFKRNGLPRDFVYYYTQILVLMVGWKRMLEANKEIIASKKALVTIFDAREHENMFTQFAKKNGLKTATLQHGHFFEMFYRDDSCYYLDIAYKGFVSDYFFAWGENAYEGAVRAGINPSSIVKVGCPSFMIKLPKHEITQNVGVVLDGGDLPYIENNYKMIDIVERYAIETEQKVVLKLHPSDSLSNYSSYLNKDHISAFTGNVKEYAETVAFSVCCNSSVFLQLLGWGCAAYHFIPSNIIDMYGSLRVGSFATYEELLDVIKSTSSHEICDYYSEPGSVKEHYEEAIKMLLS